MGPIVLLSNPSMQCLTFFWKEHPRFWVGYRVCEGLPETHPRVLSEDVAGPVAGWGAFPDPIESPPLLQNTSLPRKRWRTAYRESKHQDPTQLVFQAFGDGTASCSFLQGDNQQQVECFFQPVKDGIQMWLRLTTHTPIVGSYQIQQCLRFTGAQNWSLRRNIACVPFLSELDVQAMGHPGLTLTYSRLDDQWLNFPARHSLYATPLGSSLSDQTVDGTVDHGLIVRESLDRKVVPASYFRHTAPGETWEQIASGMYWERTVFISNRHPADCVHSTLDLGALSAGESRTVRGKFYWVEGSKDDLLAAWHRDFPGIQP